GPAKLNALAGRVRGNRAVISPLRRGSPPARGGRRLPRADLARRLFGATSPVTMVSPWFYAEVTAKEGASVPLDPDHEERAIYVIDGEVEIAGERYEGPKLLIFRPGDHITVKAVTAARMM